MSRQRISAADKQRLIRAFENGQDYQALAETLAIKSGTAWSIIRRFENTGCVVRQRGGVHNKKRDDEISSTLLSIVEENPQFTLSQINATLKSLLPHKPAMCDNTSSNILHGQMVTMKKLMDSPAERNASEVKAQRRQLVEWLIALSPDIEPIFIDESGFHLWIKRTRGRAIRGDRAVRVVGGRRSTNFSALFAVSPGRGLVHHQFITSNTNSTAFNSFLSELSLNIGHETLAVFIMDNCSIHRNHHLANLPSTHSAKFLSPYSPMFNICENAFSSWKAGVKRQMAEVRDQVILQPHPQRLATLMQLAEQNVAEITAYKCDRWFSHMQTYYGRALREEDIIY